MRILSLSRLQKVSAIPLSVSECPVKPGFLGPTHLSCVMFSFGSDGGMYLERMLSLRNHGTSRGAVRRQWALLVWD